MSNYLLKDFQCSHRDFIDEQVLEDSWEDPMLVDPGFESSQEPRLVHSSQLPPRSALVALMESVSFRLQLKNFPML